MLETITYHGKQFTILQLDLTIDGDPVVVASEELEDEFFDYKAGWFKDEEGEEVDSLITMYVPASVFNQSAANIEDYILSVLCMETGVAV